MDAFEKWVEDYALMHEREITKADCEAAFRAGMRAAALIVADHSPDTNPGSPCNAAVAAILAAADK